MKPSQPSRRRVWTGGGMGGFLQNPVYIIIIINLIFYIAALIDRAKIVLNLGLSPSLFTEKPWTIITNMFVHADFWHIFGNMITLFFFGRVVYQLIGMRRFLLVYFVGGVVGNLLYVWLGEPLSIAIGASGAVYALAGTLVVMMPTMRVAIWGILPMPLWVVILLFFVLWSIPNFIPSIAWQAHLGGLVVGLAAGFYFRRTMRYIYCR
jgi:membrane associated rhomboid family serine protease